MSLINLVDFYNNNLENYKREWNNYITVHEFLASFILNKITWEMKTSRRQIKN